LTRHSSEETITSGYSPELEAQEQGSYPGAWDLDSPPSSNPTFVGKLRLYVPSLYCTLSAWERDHLDSFYSAETFASEVTDKTEALVKDLEELATIPETVSTSPVTCLDECQPHSSIVDTPVPTNSVLPEPLLVEGSPLIPGYGEPAASEHSLDRLLSDLVPSYREVTSPVPIPTFLGKAEVVSGEPSAVTTDPVCSEVSSGKDLAWSWVWDSSYLLLRLEVPEKKWVQTFLFG
jgi:hypothetical protein